MALLPRVTYGSFLWDKHTGEVLLETHVTRALTPGEDESLDVALEELADGEVYVTRGLEFGDSIQLHDGRWTNGRAWAEVQVPCHPTRDSYLQAGLVAGDLAILFAEGGIRELEARAQQLLHKEIMEQERSR